MLRAVGVLCMAGLLLAQAPAKRHLNLDDLTRLHEVANPEISPDGQWIAYTVISVDTDGDKRDSNVWMVNWDGTQNIQLTYSLESEGSPHWSPDGKSLAFTSSRPGKPKVKGAQIWLLDRRGGEARQLTEFKEHLSDYRWSPDGKKMVLVMRESDNPDADIPPAPGAPPKPPKPIVIDRYHFKQDTEGYLSGAKHSRLYLYDLESRKAELLTTDQKFDESNPAWSPDATKIAFVSNHDDDPDRSQNSDVFVVDARPGSTPRKLTNYPGRDGGPLSWSPDSKLIAYTQGSEPKFSAYNLNRLAVVPANGAEARVVTGMLDRGVMAPLYAPDGESIQALVADDRSEYPAQVSLTDGSVERLIGGSMVIMAHTRAAGHTAVLASTDEAAPEIFAMGSSGLRKLTSHNSALMAELKLGATEDISFQSPDGTEVHGLMVKPPEYTAGQKYPTLLRIHGGPNGQDGHAFSFERQFFAANGYVVIAVNYRGSAGRGSRFSESIFNDWGHHEVEDLLAGVDHAVKMGIADPNRLGIGGWSYGGILTDYTIATDNRFKCAISGAGSANQISMYGHDQYTFQYDNEIGPPWKSPEQWLKISYPFFKADRIHTPTLFMGGDQDFNVPVAGGEQMYQALKSLGVPTELVIYPGQYHGFTRPSFIRDRYERYLAWYDKYLKSPATTERSPSSTGSQAVLR